MLALMDEFSLYQVHVFNHVHPDIDCTYCYPGPDPFVIYDEIDVKGLRRRARDMRTRARPIVKLEDIRKGTA